jgi:hypothetical protein
MLPDLHFDVLELVNEVLTFDGDGLVCEGHGTHLE